MIKEILNPKITAGLQTSSNESLIKLQSFYIRWFFVMMAALFPIIAATGFIPDYVLMSRGAFHAHWFAHVHGAIMTSWLLIFLTQAILAAKGNLNYHRKLGLFSVGLGVIVWLSAIAADVRARIATSPPAGDDSWDVLLIGIYASTLFALFFSWGILARKNAAVHKRLLLLATMVILQAAVDRTRWLPGIGAAIYVRFIYLDFLLIPLFIYDLLTVKRIHKITLIATAFLITFQLAVTLTVGSPVWHKLAFSIFAPFMEQPVEIKINDTQTDILVGDYGDKNWHMTIRRVDGTMYLKLPDQPAWEMGAISENDWFLKTMAWRISFVKSADGSVKKIVNKQPGITWEATRMK